MIFKVKQFVVNHYLAIILSILVGLLMILPQILFIIQTGDSYNGVNILATDSESNFLSRFQEIAEGDWGFSDVFLTFNKDRPYQSPYLGHVIMYRLGQIFFLSVYQIFLLTKFILPAVLFLIIYFFALLFNQNKKIALVSSVGVMLWYDISSISEFKDFLMNELIIIDPSIFSRPVIPVFGIIILFSFLSFFYLYISQSQKKYFWLSGILFGLSFYIYFFVWSFLVVFVSVSAFWFLIRKDWLNFKKIPWIIFLGALIALPYWFNFYKLMNYHSFSSSAGQVGLIVSNSIIIGKYLIVAWVLYFLNIYTRNIKGKNFWLWSSLVVSFIVILNQQLITHRVVQTGHYHWYIIKPLTIFLLLWLIFSLIQNKYKNYLRLLAIIFIVGGFYLLISQQIYTYYNSKDEIFSYSQRYASAYNWINQNTEKNQIIFSGALDIDKRRFMSGHTHLDEYLYKNKFLYPFPFEWNKHVLFLEYRLDKITPEIAKDLFFNELRDDMFYRLYAYYYRINYTDKGKSASDEEVQEILNEYTDFYKKDLELELRKYPVDYMLWDVQLDPNWNLDDFEFLELIYEVNDIKVYKFP